VVRAASAVLALPRGFIEEVGQLALLAWSALLWTFRPPYRFALAISAMEFVGFQSIFIIALTGWFSGGVLALQSVYGFRQFGAEGMVGGVVAR
jgi:phospholipid/cholesterol/gamma-HCH transport system permease protein